MRQMIPMLLLMITILVTLASGCNPHGNFCEDRTSCVQGNDEDEESCLLDMGYLEDEADMKDCVAEFDSYFECLEEHSKCVDDEYTHQGKCDAKSAKHEGCLREGKVGSYVVCFRDGHVGCIGIGEEPPYEARSKMDLDSSCSKAGYTSFYQAGPGNWDSWDQCTANCREVASWASDIECDTLPD